MTIYVIPQPVGRPPYISGPRNRNIVFVEWVHTVTEEEDGYFELWTPYVDGHTEEHHTMVHMATVELSINLDVPHKAYAFMQSPDETMRTLITELPWQAGIYSLGCPFIGVHESRGILALANAPVGLEITASYQLELI